MDFVGYDVDLLEDGGIPLIVEKPVYITIGIVNFRNTGY